MVIIPCVVGGELRGLDDLGIRWDNRSLERQRSTRVEYLWNGQLLKAMVRADGKKHGWLGKQMAGNSG